MVENLKDMQVRAHPTPVFLHYVPSKANSKNSWRTRDFRINSFLFRRYFQNCKIEFMQDLWKLKTKEI